MIKRGNVILLLVFLFLIVNVSAQPPFQEAGSGCEIEVAFIETIPANTSIEIHAHPINTTEGAGTLEALTNTTGFCYYHGYNLTNHITQQNMTFSAPFDFEISVDAGNFSETGEHPFVVGCFFEDANCIFRDTIMVTNSGTEPTEGESLLYIILFSAVLLLFLLALWIQIMLPYKTKIGDRGEILMIPKARYLKILMTLITYPLFVWVLNLMLGLSDLVRLTIYTGFFNFAFIVLSNLSWPVFIFIIIWTLWRAFKDLDIIKSIKEFGEFSK